MDRRSLAVSLLFAAAVACSRGDVAKPSTSGTTRDSAGGSVAIDDAAALAGPEGAYSSARGASFEAAGAEPCVEGKDAHAQDREGAERAPSTAEPVRSRLVISSEPVSEAGESRAEVQGGHLEGDGGFN